MQSKLLHSLRIPKVSGVAWQQAQRWIAVLKWWHLERREINLSVRSDDSALMDLRKTNKTETQSGCWPRRQFAAVMATASDSKWKMNEGDLVVSESDSGNSGFLVEAVSRLPCIYLWEQLESFEYINHGKVFETWYIYTEVEWSIAF